MHIKTAFRLVILKIVLYTVKNLIDAIIFVDHYIISKEIHAGTKFSTVFAMYAILIFLEILLKNSIDWKIRSSRCNKVKRNM